MKKVTFKNGLATANGVVTAYNAHPSTGLYAGSTTEKVTKGVGLPAFCTIQAPPAILPDELKIARFSGDGWEIIDDFRGLKAYQKSTRYVLEVTEVGPLDDSMTLEAPATEHDVWSGSAWVTDSAAAEAAAREAAEKLRADKLAEVHSATQLWQTQLLLNMISDASKAKLIEWMAYAELLQNIDISAGAAVAWPDKPSV
ncbi:tail assembly chaperone [Pantoea eucrina]|uniref:Tail assembly chaperone n=1 Tax=Pantoea eucrina TaxID=472693 RepID=A0ABS1ZAN9_9GAMM|nr:tail assembly chaperone [Pantoea eucrina]MBM0749015.1 tail assembly chaperone [Pantoea eucrina]QNH53297.1 tail assembly chaperone [Acinetobacter venetianus]